MSIFEDFQVLTVAAARFVLIYIVNQPAGRKNADEALSGPDLIYQNFFSK